MKPIERRKEQRERTGETVHLFPEAPGAAEVVGRLVNKSADGFRAVHTCGELNGGDPVRFSWPGSSGLARVVWTRISNSSVETGFRIISMSR
jgi:hypothetical protein